MTGQDVSILFFIYSFCNHIAKPIKAFYNRVKSKAAYWAAFLLKLQCKTDGHLLPNPTKKTICKF